MCARTPAALQQAAAQLGPADRIFDQPTDVTAPGQLNAFLSAAAARWQRLDILVHNA
ncbi:MAG TPA: SDR family NAD(P)-dependent oxidoreductase, partial [Candidatus Dormibacteraeota bacterium]|nr:SDR family NAD(P)-dependent oxidoreductase [Candidatus Dormibacteraeota bacterium]